MKFRKKIAKGLRDWENHVINLVALNMHLNYVYLLPTELYSETCHQPVWEQITEEVK